MWIRSADATGEPRRVTDGNWPSWTPDGTRLLVTVGTDFTDTKLAYVDVDGGEPEILPIGLPNASESAVNSLGGIAFVSSENDYADSDPATWNEDIFTVGPDGASGHRADHEHAGERPLAAVVVTVERLARVHATTGARAGRASRSSFRRASRSTSPAAPTTRSRPGARSRRRDDPRRHPARDGSAVRGRAAVPGPTSGRRPVRGRRRAVRRGPADRPRDAGGRAGRAHRCPPAARGAARDGVGDELHGTGVRPGNRHVRGDVAAELERLNDAYEARYGFRYCVFVAGRSREALLPGMAAALDARPRRRDPPGARRGRRHRHRPPCEAVGT